MTAAAYDYDVVIVGSGFGGSVMADRLAGEGRKVCLLERGKPYAPGEFPRSPAEVGRAFWDPSKGHQGMFNVWSFGDFGALVSSGLGGGSLIYANVLLRRPREWFAQDGWPVSYETLEPHYDRIERELGATRMPESTLPAKARALSVAANKLGYAWETAPLAISFSEPGKPTGAPLPFDPDSYHQRYRSTCRMCGECNIGCNYGSKNTLDHNLIPRARKKGAEVRPRHEVKSFERIEGGDGYRVDYVEHEDGKKSGDLQKKTMTCRRLVLSAGALGTPFLLLKNREGTRAPMARLGTRFSTNGDLLSIVAEARDGSDDRQIDPSRGPVITSFVQVPTARGHAYIEDAGIPDTVAWLANTLDLFPALKRASRFTFEWIKGQIVPGADRDLSAEMADFFGASSFAEASLPLLGMGRDVPNGVMRLENGWLQVDWKESGSDGFFEGMRSRMREIANALDGSFVDAPVWYLGRRVITVHPLGGCPMGKDEASGVVDSNGKVFGAGNLYVADGSVLPDPVGPNPALTIAALASHFADGMLAEIAREQAPAAGRETAASSPMD